ncbi:unnamed protein product, partial [marine sediment metagenome]
LVSADVAAVFLADFAHVDHFHTSSFVSWAALNKSY